LFFFSLLVCTGWRHILRYHTILLRSPVVLLRLFQACVALATAAFLGLSVLANVGFFRVRNNGAALYLLLSAPHRAAPSSRYPVYVTGAVKRRLLLPGLIARARVHGYLPDA